MQPDQARDAAPSRGCAEWSRAERGRAGLRGVRGPLTARPRPRGNSVPASERTRTHSHTITYVSRHLCPPLLLRPYGILLPAPSALNRTAGMSFEASQLCTPVPALTPSSSSSHFLHFHSSRHFGGEEGMLLVLPPVMSFFSRWLSSIFITFHIPSLFLQDQCETFTKPYRHSPTNLPLGIQPTLTLEELQKFSKYVNC